MDNVALAIGDAVLSFAIIGGAIWLSTISPIFAWLLKVALLVGWGAVTFGATAFVVFAIDLPRGEYGAALGAVVVGSILYLPWFFFGLPSLKACFPPAKDDLRLRE